MLRLLFLVICALGATACAANFQAELRSGKLYPSLLISSVAWAIGGLATAFLWAD